MTVRACRQFPTAAIANLLRPTYNNDITRKDDYDVFMTNSIMVAQQIIVPLHTAAQVLVATTVLRLLLIRPHFHCFPCHTTPAARVVMDAPPCLPYYITLSNFSDRPQHLPKHIAIAHAELPPATACSAPSPLPTSLTIIYRCRQTSRPLRKLPL